MRTEQASESRAATTFSGDRRRLIHSSCGQGIVAALVNNLPSIHEQQSTLP
jgi:hypothetical protein